MTIADQLIVQLEDIFENCSLGIKDTQTIQSINIILREMKTCGCFKNEVDYITSKISSKLDLLFSPRKASKYGGHEKIRDLIYQDIAGLRSIIL